MYKHPTRNFISPKLNREDNLVKTVKHDNTGAKSGLKTTKNSNNKKIAFNDTASNDSAKFISKNKMKKKGFAKGKQMTA